ALTIACSLVASTAIADEPLRWHATLGGAHALGDPQSHEFGFGVSTSLAMELPIAKVLGIQGVIGGLWLPHTNPPIGRTIAGHGDGTDFSAMLGLRLRPFGAASVAGPWIDANGGYLYTGMLSRGAFAANVGWDFRIGSTGRWDV